MRRYISKVAGESKVSKQMKTRMECEKASHTAKRETSRNKSATGAWTRVGSTADPTDRVFERSTASKNVLTGRGYVDVTIPTGDTPRTGRGTGYAASKSWQETA